MRYINVISNYLIINDQNEEFMYKVLYIIDMHFYML